MSIFAPASSIRSHRSQSSAAASVSSPPLRNAGTIGGNLCVDTRCNYYNQTEFWRALLGGMTNGPFYELKRNPERVLDTDRLTRISYVIGIFKALRILHSPALADEWIHLPNQNAIFAGGTPLDYLMRGGLPAMQTVRRLLDARRAG